MGQRDSHAARCHDKIPGGGFNGTHASDMIGEIALAIEMGADAVDVGKTNHPHPHADWWHRHGGQGGARQLHGCAAGEEVKPYGPAL